jgi:glyoxylase-like metal-dependent hydrolase (beta-lactamase superfamily II)
VIDCVCYAGVVIHPIAFAEDNYCYLVTDEQDAVSVLIDPADPDAIQVFLH